MSKDIYGVPNRHYGSEPDTERDEEAVTEEAVVVLRDNGMCPMCETYPFGDEWDIDALFDGWATAHAETCTPLRERVVARREADRE